jgi:hypothetical protein
MKHAGRLTIWAKDTDLIIDPAQEGGLNAYNDEKFDAVEERGSKGPGPDRVASLSICTCQSSP